MKKIISYFTLVVLVITFSHCKSDTKKETSTTKTSKHLNTAKFVIKPEATKVEWIGYKTSEKTPVKGQFNVLKFNAKSGVSVEDAINNLNFSIPISSLFTNNAVRDDKLKRIFFGAMDNTEFIKGVLKVSNNNCKASLTMNGITKELPLEMNITEERRLELKGTLQLADWNALKAVDAINKACFDLHKGADGVSKTWEEVAIHISSFLRAH